ncbi:Zn-dependent hydrolase, glyoxylase [Beggiatoa alba B18LD]|uniref:Zn-dependent hydrolase, glyoxylase n=1 Tax=Beggiatoa alba B18LD TaxID=395493 RepID=I3CBP3_9GAMM|nr:MBL fold metallo-hydrolase [Beggiatoa alba]EIJ41036.1 Zn-dependent hydrolase, glyoxylase [Beggiatoa alba B18LD]
MTTEQPFSITALELGPMENFIYLIRDHATNRAAVVDPAWDVPAIIAAAQAQQIQITDVLLTHSHQDHINGLNALLKVYDAQIHLLKPEAQFWGNYLDLPTLHHGGDVIQLGKTDIDVWHTPGHTPGSACYHLGGNIITGDTLFVFGCGRCDLKGGNPEQMFHTLKHMGSALSADTVIHPGHNYAQKTTTTIAEQLAGNPFMHFDKVNDFVEYRMHIHDKIRDAPYMAVPKA